MKDRLDEVVSRYAMAEKRKRIGMQKYVVVGLICLGMSGVVRAEIAGTVQGSYYVSGDNDVTGGKAFVQKSYSPNLNPSAEVIVGSEDNFGLIIGNRHGDSDKHLGYFVGFEKQDDFQDITAILEGNYNKTGAYVRGHAGDLANGADVGVRRTLVDKRLQVIAEVAGHFYDTERVGTVSAGSIGLEADFCLGKKLSLFANARGLSDEKLTGEKYSVNAGLRYNIGGKRDSFNRLPADLGLDLQHMDLGKTYVPVQTVNSSGAVSETYVSQSDFDSGVESGSITPTNGGGNTTPTTGGTTGPVIVDGGDSTGTGDNYDDSNSVDLGDGDTGNTGGDDSAGSGGTNPIGPL